MISKRQNPQSLRLNSLKLNIPSMESSVSSQSSLSNFVAQTPKENKLIMNFKKGNKGKINQFQDKQNIFNVANVKITDKNNQIIEGKNKSKLPYKMVTSQLPCSCQNHPQKQSSFYIESSQKQLIFYCQKCAILVASQGFQVIRISSETDRKVQIEKLQETIKEPVRFSLNSTKTTKKNKSEQILSKQLKQKQLNGFLNSIQRTQTKVDKVALQKQNKIEEIKENSLIQTNKIKGLFLNFQSVLNYLENKYTSQISQQSKNMIEPLENDNAYILNDIKQLENMKQDICDQFDAIINQTTQQEFFTVMKAYRQNVEEIQANIQICQHQNRNGFIDINSQLFRLEIDNQSVMNDVYKQLQSKMQSIATSRFSTKSTKRRMSLASGTNKLR